MGLNVWPCDDVLVEDSCDTEVHYHASDNEDTNRDSDHCSPFCQCYCCQLQVEHAKASNLSSESPFLSLKRAFVCTQTGQNFSNSLFEPPQIG